MGTNEEKGANWLIAYREVQAKVEKIKETEASQLREVLQRSNELCKPLFAKRNEVFGSAKYFWLYTFCRHPILGKRISKEDEKILKHMVSVEVEEDLSGCSFSFNFSPNPYFEDEKLTKMYTKEENKNPRTICQPIKWKEEKDIITGDGLDMCAETSGSFFSWFSDENVQTDGNLDEIAKIIKDDVWSDPFKYYSSGSTDDVDICPRMISIPGKKAPLDLTLKTSFRLVSSSSLKWCHRIDDTDSAVWCIHVEAHQTKEELFSKALYSWIYPPSTLPTNFISAVASSKEKSEVEFLEKRRLDWEKSFSHIYSMLTESLCSIFYVYTSEFVVLFVGGNFSGEKWSCNAYLSKSTNSLRSALTKYGVCFTMPLYHNEVVQNSPDDLAELLEKEKRNIGQAVYTDHFADVDGTSKSLLSFTGNSSVHGLCAFLLNYRFFFTGGDVPMIYSLVPFQNSSLHIAEVVCKEMRKAGMGVLSGSNEVLSNSNMCYSIEISNLIIPPWVISGICAAISADGTSFDSTFTIDHSSMGLNAALNSISHKLESDATSSSGTKVNTFGIPNTVLVPSLHTAAVQRINFTNGAYTAYTTS